MIAFLPGMLNTAAVWQPTIGALGAALGEASTGWVGDLTRDASIAEMAARVLAEVPAERFALAGLSMGGYVALEILRRAPGRVLRLALVDTQARPDTAEALERRHALVELARAGAIDPVVDRLLPLMVDSPRMGDGALVGVIRAMAREVGVEAFVRQQRSIMARVDSRPMLGTIRCPTLVLCGEHDLLTPPERHDAIAAAVPGAVKVVLPRCGHLAPLERPAEVARCLQRWLAMPDAGAALAAEPA